MIFTTCPHLEGCQFIASDCNSDVNVMSFVRIPHRSHSMSSLNSSRARKIKHKPKQAWDDSVTDLTQHRATREEIEHRRNSHKSKNADSVRLEKQEKQIAKARRKNDQSLSAGNHNDSRLLREILYDQSQLHDALSHSDRVMSVVQDLFGDDPKRNVAFPHVTLAPGQKANGFRPRGPITEAPETPSRLTALSESVMNSQALNDLEDEQGTEDSYNDSEEDKENQPVSFQGIMNVDRFQEFIKRQIVNQSSRSYDSTQPSLLQNTGNIRHNLYEMTPAKDSSQNAGVSANSATVGAAINDTVKVKKKSRSRVSKEKHKKEEEEKHKAQAHAQDLSMVLRGLEQEMIDYEVATGRLPAGDHGNTSQLPQSGVSGYTSLLVQTIAKLIGYLKETETRWIDEKKMREDLQHQVADQRILIDAITADLLATQDLQLHTQQELNKYMSHTQGQLTHIQQTLSRLGLQHSQPPAASSGSHTTSNRPRPTDPTDMMHPAQYTGMPSDPYQQDRLPPATMITSHATAVPSAHIPFSMTTNTGPYHQDTIPRTMATSHSGGTTIPHPDVTTTSLPNTTATSHPIGMATSHPIATATSHPIGMTMSHPDARTTSHPIATTLSQPAPTIAAHTTAMTPTSLPMPLSTGPYHPPIGNMSAPVDHKSTGPIGQQETISARPRTNAAQDLEDQFFTALHNASAKISGTGPQLDLKNIGSRTNQTIGLGLHTETQHSSEVHPSQEPGMNPGLNSDGHPPLSQSNFLTQKKHLGTRDASHVTFQPAILLSPPRQRDRSSLVRSRVASAGAYPMSQSDGSVIGTIHSVDRGSAVSQPEGDISVRIAQLSKQHEQAQSRLRQLKTLSGKDSFTQNDDGHHKTQLVSPPISPITSEPPQLKHVMKGSSHLAKEGRTIHVSVPRPEALEISATSTPSPKTAENRNKSRYSNTSLSSHQWKTPERHDDSTQEDQFFALSAHLST